MNPLWRKKWRSFKTSIVPNTISKLQVAPNQTQNQEIDPFSPDWCFSSSTSHSEIKEKNCYTNDKLTLDQKLYDKLEKFAKTDPII